ncbi:stalk domain-containing protein [Paenibacillus sp. GP183]|uniref:stalk domain-containing protein n=1 Tax=Paenibacillus sp. GP183 TaxID=1882751 RepID=UPI00089A8DD7|nr:stalk domain-containing protein [Paenibacillus sp. GP183]SEC82510.1 phosphate transport system substrate-binding protein [Paenibacillus sp. GP183]
MNIVFKRLMVAAIASTAILSSFATNARADDSGTVEWNLPTLPTNVKQTEEQDAFNKKNGRPLPTPEILQPALDSSLQSYKPRKDIEISGSFKGASSDVLPSLVNVWIDEFKKYYPKVNLEIVPPYAGSLGAKELMKETVDFVFVSRELKPDDVNDFKTKYGYDPLSVPISGASYRHFGFLDSMGFFVHKDNPLQKLTLDQIDAMFSSTHLRGGDPIKTWGQLGLTGDWADKPIHLYGIQPWNGFEEFIRQRILSRDGQRGEWGEGIKFDKVVFPVAGRVSEDPYGLGYSGMAYIDKPVKMLALGESEAGPYYAPTYENVVSAKYPLSRLIYFNTNKNPDKALSPVIEEFLKFILSKEGQQVVLKHAIYVPLRSWQANDSLAIVTGVPEVKVNINNKPIKFSQPAVILDGNTMVPIKDITGIYGADLTWDSSKKVATLSKGITKITLTVDSRKATLNGEDKMLEVPVQIIRHFSSVNSTMVPLRFITEAFGAKVGWDQTAHAISLN